MILLINKYHRVEAGEASNSVKVEKPTAVEAYREAKKQLYQLAANYMADSSVIDWTLALYNPTDCKVEEKMVYFSPDAPVEPEVVEETPETVES